jgi:GGDEF domain-containing protein
MLNHRSQGLVCFLIGPDQDRQGFAQFYEQAGYQVQVFKNPSVLFDYLKEFKPFIVVLDTSALRSKLSNWVSQLHMIRPQQAWMVQAPIDQYPILSTYHNRGLAEFISADQLYLQQRTLWALDREFELWNSRRKPQLDFIEKPKQELQKEVQSLENLFEQSRREAGMKQLPLSYAVLGLDDQKEILDFWGETILKQAQEMLFQVSCQLWGSDQVRTSESFVSVISYQSTSQMLTTLQSLQDQIQIKGRQKFGFKFSMSGGVSELNVHSHKTHGILKLSLEACKKMQVKGGGRVGVPKPIQEESHGDLPQDLG